MNTTKENKEINIKLYKKTELEKNRTHKYEEKKIKRANKKLKQEQLLAEQKTMLPPSSPTADQEAPRSSSVDVT